MEPSWWTHKAGVGRVGSPQDNGTQVSRDRPARKRSRRRTSSRTTQPAACLSTRRTARAQLHAYQSTVEVRSWHGGAQLKNQRWCCTPTHWPKAARSIKAGRKSRDHHMGDPNGSANRASTACLHSNSEGKQHPRASANRTVTAKPLDQTGCNRIWSYPWHTTGVGAVD